MKIISLNCRGLNNVIKRKMYFKLFNAYDVICLQETYVTKDNVNIWKKEWPGFLAAAPGTKNSQGLIILFRKSFNFHIIEESIIDERCIRIKFSVGDIPYCLFNIYMPALKRDRCPYLRKLTNVLPKYISGSNVLICGDFNCVIDNDVDIISGNPHPRKEVEYFNEFKSTLDLADCWRDSNPGRKEFTWSRFTPFVARRLDYIFVNRSILNTVHNPRHIHFSSTDHKAVSIQIKPDDFIRGPSRWQLNTSFLEEEDFIDHMTAFIPTYITNLSSTDNIDKQTQWDLLKIGIREECILYGKNKSIRLKNNNDKDNTIKILQHDLSYDPNNKDKINELQKILLQKEVSDISKTRGAMIRARSIWIEHGDKNTKYFLGLEKSTQTNNIIRSVNDKNNILKTEPAEVLNEIKTFYKLLFKDEVRTNQEENMVNFMDDLDNPQLSNEEKLLCDNHISKEEFYMP